MARSRSAVSWTKPNPDRIPDIMTEGVALVLELAGRGVLSEVGERFRIRREGGYCGFDVVLHLLFYFASSQMTGIRTLWERIRPFSRQLAATAARTRLASPASVSRALNAAEFDLVRPATRWLLGEGAGIDAVLRHPSVATYDSNGEAWHPFDFDPTVTTLRHRALPVGDDLPEPRRRSEDCAAPGYRGRKRGDVVFRRASLQHAGSSAWLWAELAPGNGEGHRELDEALDVMVEACARIGHPQARAVIRMDGGFGWVPYLDRCRARGIPFLTRLTRPELLEQQDVQRTLRDATWHFVPDSGSGPRRSATDLGAVTIPAGQDSRRPDGTPYDPVQVRVVVSRYPREGKADRGVVIDGWQYELFVADVPMTAFSAADAVAMYFGRAANENRLAQEDREAGLDRIFSYHLPGQELAVNIGLWVWNLRLVRGFELDPPPAARPSQGEYTAKVDERPSTFPDLAELTPPPPSSCTGDAPSPEVPDVPRQKLPQLGDPEIVRLLGDLDWQQLLSTRPGWRYDAATGRLVCRDGRHLVLTTVRSSVLSPGRTRIIFRRPTGGCEDCASRASCNRSTRSRAPKHAEFSVPTPIATELRDRLQQLRRTTDAGPAPAVAPAAVAPAAAPTPPRFVLQPQPITPGPRLVATSLFLPAAARRGLRRAASDLSVSIQVDAPGGEPRPLLLAASVADRQHRRCTWRENLRRYALPAAAHVNIELAGGSAIRRLLRTASA